MSKIKKGIVLCELVKRVELSNNEMRLAKGATTCNCKDVCSSIPPYGLFVAAKDPGIGLDP